MKNKSQNESGLRQLLEDQLKDVYWAEKAITKAMPEVVEKVSSQELIDALTEHMDETIQQVSRLENVFEIIGVKAEAEKCEAMEGLIEEAEDIIDELEEGPVCDAGIIAAVQKIEHYEIATYGSLRAFANILGEYEAASLLEETLEEEKSADKRLTDLAESIINLEAAAGESEETGSRTRQF
ncbi:MAG TPA: ferritin-like domain-containing protein [Bacteroidales bacterium]|nr:ferritin-like domain-containing protein [Bacteroidales bacterium]